MRYPLMIVLLAGSFLGAMAPASQPAPKPAAQPTEKTPSPKTPGESTPAKQTGNSAIVPVPRDKEEWWVKRHESMNARAKQGAEKGDIGVLFIGDSITQGWEGEGKSAWEANFAPLGAMNLGISGDRTQHVLWRLDHGNVEGLAKPKAGSAPKVAVIMIGTNNSNGNDNTAEEIGAGITAVVKSLRAKLPETKVLILAVFPRGEKPNPQREKNAGASAIAAKAADGKMVYFMDIGPKFLEADGTLTKEIMPDMLHLSPKGYEIWASSVLPKVKELMGK